MQLWDTKMGILFEWDEEKRQSNIEKHGFDFEIAKYVLSDPNVIRIKVDNYEKYGETRSLAFGKVDNYRLCLCYTMRGKIYRVISLHIANKKEWEKHHGKNS